MLRVWALALIVGAAGCAGADVDAEGAGDAASPVADVDTSPQDTAAPGHGAEDAVAVPDTPDDGAQPGDAWDPGDTAPPSPWLPAADYCERVVDAYCPYYLRCGRIAAEDADDCRKTFLETCNERYEPHYAAFEASGMLRLSAAGVAGCTLHLDHVDCAEQVGDLDGACANMWVGQVPAGGSCGPGIESLVCAEGATCVLGLDFCGTCTPESTDGTCDLDHRCPDGGQCQDGACITRPVAGEPCGVDDVCAVGLSCTGGRCLGPEIVRVGEPCDAERRCPYKSVCSGGTCQETRLLGEACVPTVGCASGYCAVTLCGKLLSAGAACTASSQCVSARCVDGACDALGPTCP